MRLIDADAYEYPGDLKDEPTIPAVLVVRCCECEYWDAEYEECKLMESERTLGWDDFDKHTKPDWFCASGKRSAGESSDEQKTISYGCSNPEAEEFMHRMFDKLFEPPKEDA